jgi:tetratricopeptide (TPR) repeat protein
LHQFKPPTLGNNLAAALKNAHELLKNLKGDHYIILLSDGDLGEKSAQEAQIITSLKKADGSLQLSIIGMGKDEAISLPMTVNNAMDDNGESIVSRRQIGWLKQFSEQMGGTYHNAESIKQIKLEQLLDLNEPRIDPESSDQIIWNEWFFLPLLGGIFFSLLALQMSGRNFLRLTSISLILFLAACEQQKTLTMSYLEFNKKVTYALLSDDSHRFSEGVVCYHLKDYICAQQIFSSLAWSASDDNLKAKAVFNLANTHFKMGDYEQASVLFKDAHRLGIAKKKTQINQAFSDSLAAAVQRHLSDIAKTKQRAKWLSTLQKLPEGFEDKLAEGIYLNEKNQDRLLFSSLFDGLSEQKKQQLVRQGVKHSNKKNIKQASAENYWVLSDQDNLPQQTADLFNQLMAFEIGLHYVPDEPLQVEGQRPW